MADRQIFHDPSGRRQKRFRIAVALFILLNLLSAAALFATIRVVPAEPPLPVALEHGIARPPSKTLLARATKDVNNAVAELLGMRPPSARQVGARRAVAAATALNKPLYVGFYVPWDQSSTFSLQRHIGELDWLAPVWLTVTGPAHDFKIIPDRNGRAVINATPHRPLILPVIQNFSNGQVDQAGIESLLADPRRAAQFARPARGLPRLPTTLRRGVRPRESRSPRRSSIISACSTRRAAVFAPHSWVITVAVPVDEGWDYAPLRSARRQTVRHGL